MKNKTLVLAFIAVVLVAAMGISPAWAYFTDSDTATGVIPIKTKPKTDIKETYKTGTKSVVVMNKEDSSTPVYVRVRVYYSGAFKSVTASGDKWDGPEDPKNDWYYYQDIVEVKSETTPLNVQIEWPKVKEGESTEGYVIGDNFNVIVVYESTPVMYDAEGNPYADWSYILDKVVENAEG